jgi:hypothetical protein
MYAGIYINKNKATEYLTMFLTNFSATIIS